MSAKPDTVAITPKAMKYANGFVVPSTGSVSSPAMAAGELRIVVWGGDGIISEAVNAAVDSGTKLGIIS